MPCLFAAVKLHTGMIALLLYFVVYRANGN